MIATLPAQTQTGLGAIADEYLRLLRIAASIEKLTPRQNAAWEFLERFFEVALFYQRYSYTHFLVRRARERYRSAVLESYSVAMFTDDSGAFRIRRWVDPSEVA